jgi:hypothetical protein
MTQSPTRIRSTIAAAPNASPLSLQRGEISSEPRVLPTLSLEELRAVLALIGSAAESALQHTTDAVLGASPVMLTTAAFAERLGDVTPETVERWCRDRRFQFARSWGKSGWRVPEFYLYAETPPDSQRAWFERGTTNENGSPTSDRGHRSARLVGEAASGERDASTPHTGSPRTDGVPLDFDPESLFDFRQASGDAHGGTPQSRRGTTRPMRKSGSA